MPLPCFLLNYFKIKFYLSKFIHLFNFISAHQDFKNIKKVKYFYPKKSKQIPKLIFTKWFDSHIKFLGLYRGYLKLHKIIIFGFILSYFSQKCKRFFHINCCGDQFLVFLGKFLFNQQK